MWSVDGEPTLATCLRVCSLGLHSTITVKVDSFEEYLVESVDHCFVDSRRCTENQRQSISKLFSFNCHFVTV